MRTASILGTGEYEFALAHQHHALEHGQPAVSGSHGGVRRARIAKAAAQTRMVSGGES